MALKKGSVVRGVLGVGMLAAIAASPCLAQDLGITETMRDLSFSRGATSFTITRSLPADDTDRALTGALTPSCPPSCIQPMQAAPGVTTVAELEVLDFMAGPVSLGTGLLVDARLQEWFARGTLPGAISMPYPALAADNSFLPDILQALGAVRGDTGWNFDNAFDLLVFGNGASSDMAPRAIAGLIAAGFPPAKLRWYRAGLTGWTALGLSITEPAG